jgi:hypothetical protein
MWGYCDCVVCLLPHQYHYLRNAVEMWMMRMIMKTWDDDAAAAAVAVVTRVLM